MKVVQLRLSPALKLVGALIVTLLVSLSVHVFMLEKLHIPYPENYPHDGWPYLIDHAGLSFAALIIYPFIQKRLIHYPIIYQFLLLTILLSMLGETLIRAPFMNGLVSSAYIDSFVRNIPALASYMWLACAAIFLNRLRLDTLLHKALAAIGITLMLQFAILPAAQAFTTFALTLAPPPDLTRFIAPPYPPHILLAAYLTYLEPVIACFALAALLWDPLGPSALKRNAQFIALVLLIKSVAFAPLIYIFYSNLTPIMSILSVGQFSLEAMLLAGLSLLFAGWLRQSCPQALCIC